MKRCIHCSLSQAPLLKKLDDGKSYYWIDLCVPGHGHEFVEVKNERVNNENLYRYVQRICTRVQDTRRLKGIS